MQASSSTRASSGRFSLTRADPRLRCASVDEAIAHFQRAVALKPDYVEAYADLGRELVKSHRFDEAVAVKHQLDSLPQHRRQSNQ
jgi:Flp pilus assembly protein TadD